MEEEKYVRKALHLNDFDKSLLREIKYAEYKDEMSKKQVVETALRYYFEYRRPIWKGM